jgi:hypothetical protein
MEYLFAVLKIVALTFVPFPVYPRLNRPDPAKNFWTFECSGFTSLFREAQPVVEKLFGKSWTTINACRTDQAPATPPARPPTRRSSIRPGESIDRSD